MADSTKTDDDADHAEHAEDAARDSGDGDDNDSDDDDDENDENDENDDENDDDSDDDAEEEEATPEAKKKSSMGTMVGILGFLLALGGGFALGQLINRDDPFAEVQAGPRLKVRLRGDEPQIGPDDALVTIIEFADYQCPYCQQASPPVMKAVDEFKGKVRIIYKHLPLPFHKAALPAAKAAWAAAQQGKFWEFHEALFVAKSSLSGLDDLIAKHGLDAEKFKVDMGSPAAAKSIDDDMKAAAVLGISGTPAFVVNGHHYRGKRDYSQWKEILEAEIDAAEDVVDGGVPAGEVYAHLMKSAVEKQAPPPSADAPGPDPEARYQVKPEGRAALGPEDALVTIVEFSDFQCPYCSRMAPVAHQIVERNPDVRFVFRNLPLSMHKQARPAALAAVAAGRQGKFWEMHDKLFGAQKQIPDAV
ncbi:MAG: thioredoxin domain-containing protein, partial [Myxococcota bacterium]